MAKIVGYIASSLDGFIATADENLDWLTNQPGLDLGEHDYHNFIGTIETVVMGRSTYDWVAKFPGDWEYAGKRVIVVTSRPIENPKGPLETRSDIDALITELRALDDGNVWMLGGGRLQMTFMEHGALDEIEVYVMSEIIGGGIPLFPPTGLRATPKLLSAKKLGPECARLHYSFT
ncbi:dihydrofolate reductase family protein [Devosia sp. 2618]|uniref:dihydrofolate reductase family protein n=1 Tax=Devosia sp. 2618 TaxID=3156454 RepID=UPI0033956A28